jgi:hypothetical protein
MTQTYPAGARGQLTSGGVIIAAGSIVAAILVLLGLVYAAGAGARHQAALAAADCEPGLSPSGLQCTTVQMLTSQYLAIVTPATQQLAGDVAGYDASEMHSVAAARAALTAEVVSENAIGTGLAAITFPPALTPVASVLMRDDRALAKLTAEQARSTSLTRMRSFNRRVQAASATVQGEMRHIRKEL